VHLVAIPIALSLSLDTWAAAVAVGLGPGSAGERRRTAVLLAGSEAAMALLGLGVGRALRLGAWLALAAGALLLLLGLSELVEGVGPRRPAPSGAWLRGLALGLGVGADEFALGLGSAALGAPSALMAPYMFVQAFVVSHFGFHLAERLGRGRARAAEKASAALFVLLAIPLLLEGLGGLTKP
jgi:putative Mn2+ efflux pump MntP